MSFTYAELKQAIQDYAENDETTFVNNLPVFIRNAEERIFKMVQLTDFRKNALGNTTASIKYLELPKAPAPHSPDLTTTSCFGYDFLQSLKPLIAVVT